MNRMRIVLCFAVLACACTESEEPGPGEDGGSSLVDGGVSGRGGSSGRGGASGSGGSGATDDGDGIEGCLVTDSTFEVATAAIDKVDLLFVIDDSGSMREEQASLSDQFPRLIDMLTTGDRDGDGVQDFPPARDLHLGVVSTDMGLVNTQGIDRCEGLGDDGIMQNTPSPDVAGCQASYPRFLSYSAGVNDPLQTANDLDCVASLGTQGCGFEQPLEAALKALWPAVDRDPETGEPLAQNRITFLGDSNGFGTLGHGDSDNLGFLRNDPATVLSAISIVLVTDEEDCSSRDLRHFAPNPDPSDPLASQPLNLRCFFNPQNLYPLERYINGLKALRPGNEQLVTFSAIVGVPPDLVAPEAYEQVDFGDSAARDQFYEHILQDPRMQEVVDSALQGELGNLVPSCSTTRGTAYPPRRIVQVARGFGQAGTVQSICQEDLGPAIEAIVANVAGQLRAPCLPRQLARGADGLTGCSVIWELPPPARAPASTPTQCGQAGFAFLSEPNSGPATAADGGTRCAVAQLPVEDGAVLPAADVSEGWYYDDFSDEVESECRGEAKQRIAFTPGAKPPAGVAVLLECPSEQGDSCGDKPNVSDDSRVGDACLPDILPLDGFEESEAYVSTPSGDCGGGPCLVYRLRGDPSAGCVPIPPDGNGEGGRVCASVQEFRERVYCSCRCDAPEGFAECDCPDGFTCVDVLTQADEALRGGYCVRDGTFTRN